jgi:hypothetical protein
MNLPAYCPSCRAIRQPNGTFCHVCGYSYLTKEAGAPAVTNTANNPPRDVYLGVGSGFLFGVGFMTAGIIFSVIGTFVWLMLLGGVFGGAFR